MFYYLFKDPKTEFQSISGPLFVAIFVDACCVPILYYFCLLLDKHVMLKNINIFGI